MEIRLEDDFNPTWEDAKVRLKVASEVFGFPFAITLDETAFAYRDFVAMSFYKLKTGEAELTDYAILAAWWKVYAKTVHTMEEAERVLYPWFHEGEEMYGDMMGRNL